LAAGDTAAIEILRALQNGSRHVESSSQNLRVLSCF
jgi:hypothetical protein